MTKLNSGKSKKCPFYKVQRKKFGRIDSCFVVAVVVVMKTSNDFKNKGKTKSKKFNEVKKA
jgi:hypothetical protein